jgi:hypothetical protein
VEKFQKASFPKDLKVLLCKTSYRAEANNAFEIVHTNFCSCIILIKIFWTVENAIAIQME